MKYYFPFSWNHEMLEIQNLLSDDMTSVSVAGSSLSRDPIASKSAGWMDPDH